MRIVRFCSTVCKRRQKSQLHRAAICMQGLHTIMPGLNAAPTAAATDTATPTVVHCSNCKDHLVRTACIKVHKLHVSTRLSAVVAARATRRHRSSMRTAVPRVGFWRCRLCRCLRQPGTRLSTTSRAVQIGTLEPSSRPATATSWCAFSAGVLSLKEKLTAKSFSGQHVESTLF